MHFKFDITEFNAAWPAIIAVVSVLNGLLMRFFSPSVERFISAIISIPAGHIANAVEDIAVIWKDLTGNGRPMPPPPTALLATIVFLGIGSAGCGGTFQSPKSLPGDVGGAVACVLADALEGKAVDNCIVTYGQALVADASQILLDSKEHPEAKANLTLYRQSVRREE